MYRGAYTEFMDDAPDVARARERHAVDHAIGLLQAATHNGIASRDAVEALSFVRRLWGLFIEDLANSDNDLPAALRADLISVGIWILRETEEIRLGRTVDFAPLIETMTLIREGLR